MGVFVDHFFHDNNEGNLSTLLVPCLLFYLTKYQWFESSLIIVGSAEDGFTDENRRCNRNEGHRRRITK